MSTSHTLSIWDAKGGFQSNNGPATFPLGASILAGGSTSTVNPEGVLTTQLTPASNADTSEDVLQTFALPANTLSAVGKGLKIRAWGSTAATGSNAKVMKLYFGSEVITTPSANTNNKNWYLELEVYKTGSSTQAVFGKGIVDTTSVTPLNTTGAETDTAAITIKCTGTGAAAADITCSALIVEVLN